MKGPYIVGTLGPNYNTDGQRPAVNTFTAFQDIFGAPQMIIPKMLLERGLCLELYASGVYSTTGTPTLSAGFWFNGAALAAPTSILGQSQLAAAGGTAVANAPWQLGWRGVLRAAATGASGGSWRGLGWAKLGSSVTPFNTLVEWNLPVTEALRTVTCDVTADRAVGVGWQWGTSSASNTVAVDQFEVRVTT